MSRTFVTQGSSRNVFVDDTFPEEVIKRPIPERFMAGYSQNKAETENYRISRESGLSCFAKVAWNSEDFSEIRSEKCKKADYQDFESRYRESFTKNMVPENEDILKFFAWKTNLAFNKILDAAEKRGISRKVENFVKFIEMERDILVACGSPTVNLIIDMFLNNNENLKLFKEILSFSVENKNRLLVDDLWNPIQYGIDRNGNVVVIDYGYSVDLSKSILYGFRKQKTGLLPDITSFKKSFSIGNFLFGVDAENRTQMMDSEGKWWSKSTKTVYMRPNDAVMSIRAVRNKVDFLRVFRVESDWKTSLAFEELVDEKRIPIVENVWISDVPARGLVPLEFYITEDNIVRSFYSTVFVGGLENMAIEEVKDGI